MIIYRAYEQLTLFYNSVSGLGKKKLSRSGNSSATVFPYITDCFWKGIRTNSVDLFTDTIGYD